MPRKKRLEAVNNILEKGGSGMKDDATAICEMHFTVEECLLLVSINQLIENSPRSFDSNVYGNLHGLTDRFNTEQRGFSQTFCRFELDLFKDFLDAYCELISAEILELSRYEQDLVMPLYNEASSLIRKLCR